MSNPRDDDPVVALYMPAAITNGLVGGVVGTFLVANGAPVAAAVVVSTNLAALVLVVLGGELLL